jgi:hypothetical protein
MAMRLGQMTRRCEQQEALDLARLPKQGRARGEHKRCSQLRLSTVGTGSEMHDRTDSISCVHSPMLADSDKPSQFKAVGCCAGDACSFVHPKLHLCAVMTLVSMATKITIHCQCSRTAFVLSKAPTTNRPECVSKSCWRTCLSSRLLVLPVQQSSSFRIMRLAPRRASTLTAVSSGMFPEI